MWLMMMLGTPVKSRFEWQTRFFSKVFQEWVAFLVAGAALWRPPSSFCVGRSPLDVLSGGFLANRIVRAACQHHTASHCFKSIGRMEIDNPVSVNVTLGVMGRLAADRYCRPWRGFLFPECKAKGSRSTLGARGWDVFSWRCFFVCNRLQSFATVRNRPRLSS